jgi:hypothetical protein
MSISPHTTIVSEPATLPAEVCLDDAQSFETDELASMLSGHGLLAAQAMRLLIRLDQNLRKARAQFNQDWFRRIMRARPKAVSRLRRRWSKMAPPPPIPLGSLRRRYHANLAKYLYKQ